MKKWILSLFSLTVLVYCSACGTNTHFIQEDKTTQNTEVIFTQEPSTNENTPVFIYSVNELSQILQKNKKLKIQEDTSLCIFMDSDKRFEIQIGEWDTNISTIYCTIYKKSPLDNPKLKNDFFEIMKTIFSAFSEELDISKIEPEFSKLHNPYQAIELDYSENIQLFFGRMGNDFDFRIYPK